MFSSNLTWWEMEPSKSNAIAITAESFAPSPLVNAKTRGVIPFLSLSGTKGAWSTLSKNLSRTSKYNKRSQTVLIFSLTDKITFGIKILTAISKHSRLNLFQAIEFSDAPSDDIKVNKWSINPEKDVFKPILIIT